MEELRKIEGDGAQYLNFTTKKENRLLSFTRKADFMHNPFTSK